MPDEPFVYGAVYRIRKSFDAERGRFEEGERLTYYRYGSSFYDAMQGWFFKDGEGMRAWDMSTSREPDDWEEYFELVAEPSKLIEAAERGDVAMARGALPGEDVQRELAIRRAIERGHHPVSELLIEQAAGSHLRAAATAGQLSIAQMLLDRGVDVNESDEVQQSALRHAGYHGHEPMVKLLLSRGAEISERVRSMAERDDRAAIRAILETGSASYRLSFEEKQRRLDAATVAFQCGFTASAREQFEALLALDPKAHLARARLASLVAYGQTAEAHRRALGMLRVSAFGDHASEIQYALGMSLLAAGEAEEAATCFHALEEDEALGVIGHYGVATCCERLGDAAGACRALQRGLELDSDAERKAANSETLRVLREQVEALGDDARAPVEEAPPDPEPCGEPMDVAQAGCGCDARLSLAVGFRAHRRKQVVACLKCGEARGLIDERYHDRFKGPVGGFHSLAIPSELESWVLGWPRIAPSDDELLLLPASERAMDHGQLESVVDALREEQGALDLRERFEAAGYPDAPAPALAPPYLQPLVAISRALDCAPDASFDELLDRYAHGFSPVVSLLWPMMRAREDLAERLAETLTDPRLSRRLRALDLLERYQKESEGALPPPLLAAVVARLDEGTASFDEIKTLIAVVTSAGRDASAAINALERIGASWGLAFPDHLKQALASALAAIGS